MPLGSGPRGFKDWQRETPWDLTPFFAAGAQAFEGLHVFPRVESSRYASLLGALTAGTNPVQVVIHYYTGLVPEGVSLATQKFVLDPNIVGRFSFVVPILGPFIEVELVPELVSTKYTVGGGLMLSNRQPTLPFQPSTSVLLTANHVFGGAESVTLYPTSYFAGAARLFIGKEAQTLDWLIEAETEPGKWVEIDHLSVAAATKLQATDIVVPAGAWRVTLVSGAAQTVNFALVPSLTGST